MKVAILTGGGDCLNAVIRAVVRRGEQHRFEFRQSVSGILHLGGTILGTSRTNPFKGEGALGDDGRPARRRHRLGLARRGDEAAAPHRSTAGTAHP